MGMMGGGGMPKDMGARMHNMEQRMDMMQMMMQRMGAPEVAHQCQCRINKCRCRCPNE